jgi:hypothetical protein
LSQLITGKTLKGKRFLVNEEVICFWFFEQANECVPGHGDVGFVTSDYGSYQQTKGTYHILFRALLHTKITPLLIFLVGFKLSHISCTLSRVWVLMLCDPFLHVPKGYSSY